MLAVQLPSGWIGVNRLAQLGLLYQYPPETTGSFPTKINTATQLVAGLAFSTKPLRLPCEPKAGRFVIMMDGLAALADEKKQASNTPAIRAAIRGEIIFRFMSITLH